MAQSDLLKALKAAADYRKFNKIKFYKPYGHPDTLFGPENPNVPEWSNKPWQWDFHRLGREFPERMEMAANRVGKTEGAAAETTYHLTGDYPDWWEGKYFDKGITAWTGSPTNQSSRDIVQKALLGGLGREELGTGFIPRSKIIGKPKTKQAGVSDVADMVKVRHVSGDVSTVVFKTYDQGWRTWQGTEPEVVWDDEEPSRGEFPTKDDYRVFTEAQTRIITSDGILMVTFTPLYGQTQLVEHFNSGIPGTVLITASWEDAPHLKEEDKKRLRASYPDYEVQARTMGVPMMGEGRVFTISEDEVRCEPFQIPHYFHQICGVDFGIDHPFAAVWIAWDRDKDIFYVHDCYKKKDETPVYHAEAIKKRGAWIPVSWPHDGLNREPTGGKLIARYMIYNQMGVKMLSKSARYPRGVGEKKESGSGQPQEPIILEILELMRTGRFKAFANLHPWWEEFRSYHRKSSDDGKSRIVARKDDILKATFYAMMMKRYAAPQEMTRFQPRASAPILSARI